MTQRKRPLSADAGTVPTGCFLSNKRAARIIFESPKMRIGLVVSEKQKYSHDRAPRKEVDLSECLEVSSPKESPVYQEQPQKNNANLYVKTPVICIPTDRGLLWVAQPILIADHTKHTNQGAFGQSNCGERNFTRSAAQQLLMPDGLLFASFFFFFTFWGILPASAVLHPACLSLVIEKPHRSRYEYGQHHQSLKMDPNLYRRAQVHEMHPLLLPRQDDYRGGWPLGYMGPQCPSDAPVVCKRDIDKEPQGCCPQGQFCVTTISEVYCCPTGKFFSFLLLP